MPVSFRCIPGLLVLGLAACASSPESIPDPARPDDAPSVLDGTYDPDSWQWQEQSDGAYLLTHDTLEQCFVAVDWPMHAFGNEGESRKRTQRSVDGIRYTVSERELGEGLREVHYQRIGEPAQFSVFGSPECQKAARDVLSHLEKRAGSND